MLLCVCVLVGAFAVSGNSSNTETYTFDFEEKTSGSYNGSTGWSYDKPSGGIAGNNTSLLKYDPPNKTTYNIAFIMPEAQNSKSEGVTAEASAIQRATRRTSRIFSV